MATVGKKFTSPEKWEEAWFLDLAPGQKLLWQYLWDRCDHAGVVNIVPRIWALHIGQEITEDALDKFIQAANKHTERIYRKDQKLWFIHYIRFQQKPDKSKPLSAKKPFNKTVLECVKKHGLLDEINKRDEILFSDLKEKNGVSSVSMPYPSNSHGTPMATSKSTSTSKSNGSGKSQSADVVRSIKDNLPGNMFIDIGEIALQTDIERAMEALARCDVKDPATYLIDQSKGVGVEDNDWEKWIGQFLNHNPTETPF